MKLKSLLLLNTMSSMDSTTRALRVSLGRLTNKKKHRPKGGPDYSMISSMMTCTWRLACKFLALCLQTTTRLWKACWFGTHQTMTCSSWETHRDSPHFLLLLTRTKTWASRSYSNTLKKETLRAPWRDGSTPKTLRVLLLYIWLPSMEAISCSNLWLRMLRQTWLLSIKQGAQCFT